MPFGPASSAVTRKTTPSRTRKTPLNGSPFLASVDARRYDRQPRGIYREVETVQSEPFDVGTRGTRCGDIYFARQGGEIQHVLARDVDRSLVRVRCGHQREARGGPQGGRELRVVNLEAGMSLPRAGARGL